VINITQKKIESRV